MGLINRVLKPVAKPILGTFHAAQQLAGMAPQHQTALSHGIYQQAPQQAARFAYQQSGLGDTLRFATHPTLGNAGRALLAAPMPGHSALTGVSAAVTLAPGPLRAKLVEELGRLGTMQLNKEADARRLVLNELNPAAKFLASLEPFRGKVEPGKAYFAPHATNPFGVAVEDRTAFIQDPHTGTMFGNFGVTHGDLIDWVAKHVPQYAGKKDYTHWFQHELFNGGPLDNGDIIPSRINWGTHITKDTEAATAGRMHLLKALRKAGIKPAPGGVTEVPSIREALARRSH